MAAGVALTPAVGAQQQQSSDATLFSLSIESDLRQTRMFPEFDPAVDRYDVAVPSGETEVTVKVVPNHSGATIKLDSSRTGSSAVYWLEPDLNTGDYTLELRTDRYTSLSIDVTAEDGTEKEYEVRIEVASSEEKGWRVYNDVPMDRLVVPTDRLVDGPQLPSHYIRGLWASDSRVFTTAWRHETIDETFYIDQKLYAFDAADSSRLLDEEFGLSGSPDAGIWSDGTTLWALDSDGPLRAYNLSTGLEIPEYGTDLRPDGYYDTREVYAPRGIWSDGDTLWVVGKDNADNAKVFAFALPKDCSRSDNYCRKSNLDFELSDGNDNPWGITGNDDTWWVTEIGERGMTTDARKIRNIYAYNRSDHTRDADKDIDLSQLNIGNTQQLYYGLAATDTIMYVAEFITGRVYSFSMPGVMGPVAPALVSSDATLSSLSLRLHMALDDTVLDPTFSPKQTHYFAQVEPDDASITVTATPNPAAQGAVVKVGGTIAANGVVPLNEGTNGMPGVTTILIEVTAQDGSKQTYTVTVTRAEPPPSTDATLSALELSGVPAATLGFSSGDVDYDVDVANGLTSTAVTATPNDSAASYVVRLGGVADADGEVDLAVGANEVTVVVTAEDGQTTQTYTVTVTRAEPPPSTDATLSALGLSGVPAATVGFSSGDVDYDVDVANGLTSTAVTATPNDSAASYVVRLGGVADADGEVDLAVGANEVTVVVTAEDGQTTQTYTVTVTRAEPPPSTDATLSALGLSGVPSATLGFSSGDVDYDVDVANGLTSTAVTATPNDSAASYVVRLGGVADADGEVDLAVGANEVTVVVTAEDGQTTQTYTVTVTRAEPPPSTDATLSALGLSGVPSATLGFSSGDVDYDVDVANGLTSTAVTATPNDSAASYVVRLGGVADADGEVDLAVGANEVTVVVTAEDGQTTQTYTVTVTRAEPPPSTDATLSALGLSGVPSATLGFSSGDVDYDVDVANGLTSTAVTATPNDSAASYVVRLGGVADADGEVDLAVGANEVTVVVTAEDGQTTQTYTVTVTRAEPPPSTDATLSALGLSGVPSATLGFSSGDVDYDVDVANGLTSTAVTATPNDSAASYVVRLGGVADADGEVDLAVGANEVTVVVTAADGQTTQTYTVTVTRAASNTQSPRTSTPGNKNPGQSFNPGAVFVNPGGGGGGGGGSNPDTTTVGESPSDESDSSDDESDDFTPLDDAGDAGTETEAAINALHRLGVFTGTLCQSNRLCPDDPMPRWIAAVWLVRLIDGDDPPAVTESRFEDVNASPMWEESVWYAPHVERLADLEITVGCSTDPDLFCPDVSLTRAQVASWLVRAFDLESAESQGFVDAVDSAHEANIDAAVAAGVMSGCSTSPKNFCLTDTVTKGEMARYVYAARNVSLGIS